MADNLLAAEGIRKEFGGLVAVNDVDFFIPRGSIVGLIGPNGAGKTTFVDALTGFVPTAEGAITYDGWRIDRAPPHQRARRGLVRTFQSIELFEDLTVRENVLAAAERSRWWSMLADTVAPRRGSTPGDVDWALALLGLDDCRDRLPSALSQGRRKLVGVARALASRPKLLLLDEPAAGLDTGESRTLGRHLRDVLGHDITVLLVDHDMGLVLGVCDTLWVLDYGRVIASGTPDEIRRNQDVIAAYLGGEASPNGDR
ncbi:MAG: ABC transporter ATP-binding protein [Gaiellaceae bacterium]